MNKIAKIINDVKFEEIQIKLPTGGFIAAKFWGDKSVRPFVCLHGWLDNAGSFDKLIPLLPHEYSYLAIDFPGHGKSSWLPHGVHYSPYSVLTVVKLIMIEFKWNKISFIGHSIGSIIAFLFAVIYPENVDLVISFDIVKPVTCPEKLITIILKLMTNEFLITDERQTKTIEPPAYTYEEALEKVVNATAGSVSKEHGPFLLDRNIKPSTIHPGKYFFSRDGRLKTPIELGMPHEVVLTYVRNFKVPFLVLKSTKGMTFEKEEYTEEALEILKTLPNFEYHLIDSSSHHLHLTEPEKIAGIISKFLKKHRPTMSHL